MTGRLSFQVTDFVESLFEQNQVSSSESPLKKLGYINTHLLTVLVVHVFSRLHPFQKVQIRLQDLF